MRYLAAIACLTALCIVVSCGRRTNESAPQDADGKSTSANEGAAGTGGWFTSTGSSSAPSSAQKITWWLTALIALGFSAVLYLLTWIGHIGGDEG